MRIFGGKSRLTVRTPNQPDTVTIDDWRPLQLDIQVRSPFSRSVAHVLVTDFKLL
jgi:hypothetical protein